MKAEKKGVTAVSAIIVILVVAALILVPLLKHNSVSGYMKDELQNVDNVSLISRCSEVEGKKNSVAGVKESVRLGANAVIVDLCFRKDGTPVITESYSNADSAETVDELFKAMSEEKFKKIGIYLNIVQLSDISKLNTLAVNYNMLDRLFLIGIDSDRYDLISTDDTIVPFLLDYTFESDELSAVKDGSFKGGCSVTYGIADDGVRLDLQRSLFSLFTQSDYDAIIERVKADPTMISSLVTADDAKNIVLGDDQELSSIFSLNHVLIFTN